MADDSRIAWTRSTFNPWVGCTKIGPGCDGCYAETLDRRHKWGGGTHWGPGVPRYRTSPANWAKLLAWNKAAPDSEFAGRKGFWPVFCASLADVFDNEVPDEWRYDLFDLIDRTPNLTWLLLTKRIGNARKMLPWADNPHGGDELAPQNVWLGASVVNQEEADRDIPKLLAIPAVKRFVSYEPAIGPVDFVYASNQECKHETGYNEPDTNAWICRRCENNTEIGIDWIIVGGESSQPGHPARPFDIEWARSTIEQCKAARLPVFMKQIGSNPAPIVIEAGSVRERLWLKDRAGADPAEWPEDLRVREFP